MVLTTSMVFTQTDGIELVLLNNTCTRGPSVIRMGDFFLHYSEFGLSKIFRLSESQSERKRKVPMRLETAPRLGREPNTSISVFECH